MENKDEINIFLASSIDEFKMERDELGYFFAKLNNTLIKQGVFARLIMCEDMSGTMVSGRKQDVYDDKIRRCDLFYALLGRRLGSCTMEEFEVAYRHMDYCGKPKIRVFFKELGSNDQQTEDILTLKRQFDGELGQPYCDFSSIDQVKLSMVQDIGDIHNIELVAKNTGIFVFGKRLTDIDPQKCNC